MIRYKGYEIEESKGHGKAVAGTKRTATIQVRQLCTGGFYIRAQIRFNVDDLEGRKRAIQKAKDKIDRGKIKRL